MEPEPAMGYVHIVKALLWLKKAEEHEITKALDTLHENLTSIIFSKSYSDHIERISRPYILKEDRFNLKNLVYALRLNVPEKIEDIYKSIASNTHQP